MNAYVGLSFCLLCRKKKSQQGRMARSAESATSPVHTERRCSCRSTSAAKTSAFRRSPKTELVMKVGLPLQLGSVRVLSGWSGKLMQTSPPLSEVSPMFHLEQLHCLMVGVVCWFKGECRLLLSPWGLFVPADGVPRPSTFHIFHCHKAFLFPFSLALSLSLSLWRSLSLARCLSLSLSAHSWLCIWTIFLIIIIISIFTLSLCLSLYVVHDVSEPCVSSSSSIFFLSFFFWPWF